jgi:hypothetical protein
MMVVLAAVPATALASTEVLEAEGELEYWAMYPAGAHSPCDGIGWSHAPEEGCLFNWEGTSEWGCIVSHWAAVCDNTNLVFYGNCQPSFDGTNHWYLYLDAQVSALYRLTTPMLLTATRSVQGLGEYSSHSVVLTGPDGTEDVLLGADDEETSAERFLEPGNYRVTIEVSGSENPGYPFETSGYWVVNWEGTVATDLQSWDSIKAIYR